MITNTEKNNRNKKNNTKKSNGEFGKEGLTKKIWMKFHVF